MRNPGSCIFTCSIFCLNTDEELEHKPKVLSEKLHVGEDEQLKKETKGDHKTATFMIRSCGKGQ